MVVRGSGGGGANIGFWGKPTGPEKKGVSCSVLEEKSRGGGPRYVQTEKKEKFKVGS